MADSNKEIKVKVKGFSPMEIELSDNKKYTIRKKKEQDVDFKDDKEEKEIDIEIKAKDDADDKYKPAKLKVKYKSSWWTDKVEVSSKDITSFTTAKLKAEKDVGFGVKGFTWTFWGVIVAVFVIFALLIWWWIASSKKEDKEEESL